MDRRRFASSKGSGFVIDVGHELTSVVPIYDGFVLRKGTLPPFPSSSFHASHSRHALSELAIQKQPAAGALISSILLDSLKKQSPAFPIVPQYLVKSKTPVDPSTPANAILR
jgi:actin-related protein 4